MARPADRQGSEASRPGQGSGGKEPETVIMGAVTRGRADLGSSGFAPRAR